MKYILVEVIEREISTPEIFDSHEDAHGRMCEFVAEVLDTTREEVKESYLNGGEINDQTYVGKNEAWTERRGNNFDWKIFELHDDLQVGF